MNPFSRALTLLQSRQDLAFVGILMTTIAVMIIPLPIWLLDGLIALNLSLTVLILLVAVYLDRSTNFATFPAVILLATTFRLALSISITRAILTSADGGEIVATFGHFVTGNNVAVGLVIFLVIAIVQFVVVTKGAERVAEVSARFVLDALPGRQMSIDADLRAGDITADEARARRRQVDKENQFFGAMDGAMKFVKGDAIAGLLIVAVNLIGGLVIGVVQMKMSVGEAARVYSLLTVGDGLLAQIPALLIAMCAGMVITRVTTEDGTDLGSEIVTDLSHSARSIGVAGAVVMALGLVPGFPTLIFLLLGAALVGIAVLSTRRRRSRDEGAQEAPAKEAKGMQAQPGERVVLRVGAGLAQAISEADFVTARETALDGFEERFGVQLPTFGVSADPALADERVVIEIDRVPLTEASLPPGFVLALADTAVLDLAGVEHRPAGALATRSDAVLVPEADVERLRGMGVETLGASAALVAYVMAAMEERIALFIGFDQIQAMMRALRAAHPELADQVMTTVAMNRALDVVRRLVDERVPLTPIRRIYETLVEWAPRENDQSILIEQVRFAMRQQICHGLADAQRTIPVYVVEPDLDQALRASLKHTDHGVVMAMPPATAERLLAQVQQIRPPLDPGAPRPVIVVNTDLRRHVRGFLAGQNLDVAVIAFQEIAREFSTHPVGTLSLGSVRSFGFAA